MLHMSNLHQPLSCKNSLYLFKNILAKVYVNHLQNTALMMFRQKHYGQALMLYLELAFYGFDIGRLNANIILGKFSIYLKDFRASHPWDIESVLNEEPEIKQFFDNTPPNLMVFVEKFVPYMLKPLLKSDYYKFHLQAKTKQDFETFHGQYGTFYRKITQFVKDKFVHYHSSDNEANNLSNHDNQLFELYKRLAVSLARNQNRFGLLMIVDYAAQRLEENYFLAKTLLYGFVLNNPSQYKLLAKFSKTKDETLDADFAEHIKIQMNLSFDTKYSREHFGKLGIASDSLLPIALIKKYFHILSFHTQELRQDIKEKQELLNTVVEKLKNIESKQYFIEHYKKEYQAYGFYYGAKYFQNLRAYYDFELDVSQKIDDFFLKVVVCEGGFNGRPLILIGVTRCFIMT